jgi:two-component system, chemotaxis family, chemotaxis protein CheY
MKSPHDFPNLNPKPPGGIKPSGRPYRVLVIEDKDFQRKQLVQILESEGYSVLAAVANGKEALEFYKNNANDLDLITTDLDMPVLDGYAFMYEISQLNPKAKIVFISEDTTKGVLGDLLKMGVTDYILKPLNRILILDRIRLALEKDKDKPK